MFGIDIYSLKTLSFSLGVVGFTLFLTIFFILKVDSWIKKDAAKSTSTKNG